MTPDPQSRARLWIARAFSAVEDLVYVSLGVILAGAAVVLLVSAVTTFVQKFAAGTLVLGMVTLLDQILLILLVVELLYTVQVSFREHAVVPEPFLLVGLIAAIRRVLILTAIFGETGPKSDMFVRQLIYELAILTVLIVVLALSLYILRRRDTTSTARSG
jgi:uncharacterized membrane protein (DUF373 family)